MNNQAVQQAEAGAEKQWALIVGLWVVAWGLVFHDALFTAARVWIVNDTFNHCFFVVPAVLYAVWRQRGAIAQQAPAYSWLGLLAVLAALFVYALGKAAYAELLQHLAIFGLLPAMALYLFGWRVIRVIWAPLAFTLFAVPVGEELMPLFQDITADMAVAMLKVIGVPVFRDGLYISVANGNFVVAEACSGVRFFIACVVIGFAYAYLNFVSVWRSLAFLVFSVVMPIVANGIRAFGIIYIGHITNMEHAAGADHLIYGWFFFAVVVVLLVLAGHWFSDGHRAWQSEVTQVAPEWSQRSAVRFWLAAALPFVVSLAIAGLVNQQQNLKFNVETASLTVATAEQVNSQDWTPRFDDADEYRLGGDALNGVRWYQAVYFVNEPGREMLKWSQRFFDLKKWTLKGQYPQDVPGLGTVMVSHLTSLRGEQRLLAHWFVLPGGIESNHLKVKLWQAVNTLFLQPSGGAVIAVSMSYQGDLPAAKTQLADVLGRQAQALSTLAASD